MLISVIIPSHNRYPLLLKALEALSRQTLKEDQFEVIVAASACSDETVARLKPRVNDRFRLVEVRKGTPARSRNAGAKLARGTYLAFTDDDCIPEPDWLANLLKAIAEEPSRVGVGGRTATTDTGRTPLTHQVENDGGMDLIPTCNLIVRKDLFDALGGFSEEFNFLNEDTDFSWRLESFGSLYYDPKALVVHPPRPGTFKAKVEWMKNLESEFLLASRNPRLYAARRGSPWHFIYWTMMVKEHKRYLKSALGDIVLRKRPDWCLIRVALVLARSGYCLLLFPQFRALANAKK